jgi:hypothetical protein
MRFFYAVLRIFGDLRAIGRGRYGRRLVNREIGRATRRLFLR